MRKRNDEDYSLESKDKMKSDASVTELLALPDFSGWLALAAGLVDC